MKKSTKIIGGIALIAVAVLFTLKAFDIFDFDVFFKGWWTLFIIVPSIVGIINDRDKTGGCIGLTVGIMLLLAARDIIKYSMLWKLAVPVALVFLGIKLIIGGVRGNKGYNVEAQMRRDGKPLKSGFSSFSATKLNYAGEEFNGAELNAVFGGIERQKEHSRLFRRLSKQPKIRQMPPLRIWLFFAVPSFYVNPAEKPRGIYIKCKLIIVCFVRTLIPYSAEH